MEIEIKFEVASQKQLDLLRKASQLCGYKLVQRADQQMIDTYYDTPDYSLLRHGLALRLRAVGDELVVGVKSVPNVGRSEKSDLHVRSELEVSLAQPAQNMTTATQLSLATLPEAIQQHLLTIVPDISVVQPTRRLAQRRTRRMLLSTGEGDHAVYELAELSLDEVGVLLPRVIASVDPSIQWQQVDTLFELEVELTNHANNAGKTGKNALRALAKRLKHIGGLRSSKRNKLLRALEKTSQTINAKTPVQGLLVAELCRQIWWQQLIQLLALEAVMVAGDTDAVHDMRVAIRRARAAAKLFEQYFVASKEYPLQDWLKGMRQTARQLGEVRDLDVALEKLDAFQAEHQQTEAADLQTLRATWQTERQVQAAKLQAWLISPEYSQLVTALADFCQQPGVGVRPARIVANKTPKPTEARHILPALLMERFKNVRAFEAVLEDGATSPDLELLHTLRIECKYLRYSLEFSQPWLGEQTGLVIKQLKVLQGKLGDLNDAAVGVDMLDAYLEAHHPTGAIAGLENYRQTLEGAIDKLRCGAYEEFDSFVALASRRRLLNAIVRI